MYNDNEEIFAKFRKREVISESIASFYTFPHLSNLYKKDLENINDLLYEGFGDYVDKFKSFISDSVLNKLIKLILSKIEVDNNTVKESRVLEAEILRSTNYSYFDNDEFLIESFLNESDISYHLGVLLTEAVTSKAQLNRNRKYINAIKGKFEELARKLAECFRFFSPKQQASKWDVIDLLRKQKKPTKPVTMYIKNLFKEYDELAAELAKFGEQYSYNTFKYNADSAFDIIQNRSSSVIAPHDPSKPYVPSGLPDPSILKPTKRMVAASTGVNIPVQTTPTPIPQNVSSNKEGLFKRILNWLSIHKTISIATAATLLGAIAYISGHPKEVIGAVSGLLAAKGLMFDLASKLESVNYSKEDFIKAIKRAANSLLD